MSPRIVPQEVAGPLPELFENMAWDTGSISWDEEADLKRVIRYVRGSKLLKIPESWRSVIPTSI